MFFVVTEGCQATAPLLCNTTILAKLNNLFMVLFYPTPT